MNEMGSVEQDRWMASIVERYEQRIAQLERELAAAQRIVEQLRIELSDTKGDDS